ncbi:Molybdenum cofactor sulfurase [Phaffia rhodozyma]|uniref:Molybdenum cofactor sulfurase n=1 Tax=Phaffia rhodozyma TaxID=264483 RepID=A0A0F7SRF3_PHARH|nr:Molybdenum cofactor sulfurase [Phaffia rhodozyma]
MGQVIRFQDLNLWSLTLTGVSPPPDDPSNEILSKFFGRPVRICQKSGDVRGPGKKAPSSGLGYSKSTTAFADTYPLHMISLQSLRSIARSITDLTPSIPGSTENEFDFSINNAIQRLRPNIVVDLDDGSEPDDIQGAFEEDKWGRLELIHLTGESGGDDILVVGECVRCTLPNVDPDTGVRHPTLPHKVISSERPKKVDEFVGVLCPLLGVYAIPIARNETNGLDPEGVWRVGDRVKVKNIVDRSI